MAAAGAGEETDSAMVVMSLVGVTASRERPGAGVKLKADQRLGCGLLPLLLLLMLVRKAAYCTLDCQV